MLEFSAQGPIARVVPELSLDKAYDYRVPEALDIAAQPGMRVRVPFGRRYLNGYIVARRMGSEVDPAALKSIEEVLGERPVISPALLELGHWMADYYCAPLGAALRTLLPAAVRRTGAKHKERLWVAPRAGIDVAQAAALVRGAKAQTAAWTFLQEHGGGWLAQLCESSGISAGVWRGLQAKGLVTLERNVQERDPLAGHSESIPTDAAGGGPGGFSLTGEQQAALDAIEAERRAEAPRPVLLMGVTGSGKTEVYLQAIARVLAEGKTALILVPEIVLTPQAVERFRRRFADLGAQLSVLHSGLSDGERHDQWHQIREGKVAAVIGARSAVFAPLPRLGLIVVDEEHENTYKQEEAPRYQGRDVAVMRAQLEKVPVVLGSATPSLESWQNAQIGKYQLVRLTERVEALRLPIVHVIDLRQSFRKEAKSKEANPGPALLSPVLVEAVHQRLARREQVIVFLNRRGYSTALQCPSCGHTQMCPHCSVPLTYHHRRRQLCCHLCDTSLGVPERCPECGFEDYRYSGAGTEKIEQALVEAFPSATVARMDSDTMRGKDAHARVLADFARGKIDILAGTQMIAKGLHFPNVTCVGVVHADLALQLPDFRASERVFQLLMQVAGRCGRGDVAGEVYVQTKTPFHPAIQFARHHDYDGFAEAELEFRRTLGYPPFARAILCEWTGHDEAKTQFVAEGMTRRLLESVQGLAEGVGPSPAPIFKVRDRYRFQLFLRAKKILPVVRALRPLVMDARLPSGVVFTIDVDPLSML